MSDIRLRHPLSHTPAFDRGCSLSPKGVRAFPSSSAARLSRPDHNMSKAVRVAVCQGCQNPIRDRYLLSSLGRSWHEDCLKCACCEARLGEVGASLYTRADLILCKRDYLRLFGSTGYCSACAKLIPAFEMVMRAKANVYHLECFACQLCGHRFCVGDRFYLSENKILCESDYNERSGFVSGCGGFGSSGMVGAVACAGVCAGVVHGVKVCSVAGCDGGTWPPCGFQQQRRQ